MEFVEGQLVARRGCGVRRVLEVVRVEPPPQSPPVQNTGGEGKGEGEVRVWVQPRRVVAVYPEGRERLVLCGEVGEVRELKRRDVVEVVL